MGNSESEQGRGSVRASAEEAMCLCSWAQVTLLLSRRGELTELPVGTVHDSSSSALVSLTLA